MIRFGRFELDPVQGLRRGRQEIHVTPKALAVLATLARDAGRVVTKQQLLDAVWRETAVSDSTLTSCIKELRQALGDDAGRPRYIETLHRRGYRFIATVVDAEDAESAHAAVASAAPAALVGREGALGTLRTALARAEAGRRQIVFLTGDAGIGKTAVVREFLRGVAAAGQVRAAGAGCVERLGAGEPYQPLLEALTRLCRQPGGSRFMKVLDLCAPTWLAQLPALQSPGRFAALQRRTAGSTRDRMLRELTDALETATASSPLLLWLEDLHWADTATLDWIAAFGRRPEPARVLLLGTFRPGTSEAASGLAPMVQDLRLAGLCQMLPLPGLSAEAFAAFVAHRYPPAEEAHGVLRRLADQIRAHTDGNALFADNVLSDLAERGLLVRAGHGWTAAAPVDEIVLGIPADVRRVVERDLNRLPAAERELLEVASVAGVRSSTAAIAAGAGRTPPEVEATLLALARRTRFVEEAGVEQWSDGTVAARFAFRHSLYREVLHAGLTPARRADLHVRVGLRKESGYAERAHDIAGELAMHFEEGRDISRAIVYLQQAGHTAVRRSALAEAQRHLGRALTLVGSLAASRERDEREVAVRIALGGALMAMQGWGAPGAEEMYARARALRHRLGDTPQLFPALWGLWLFYWGRGELATARPLADNLLELATREGDRQLLLQAHHAMWATCFSLGEPEMAHRHAVEGIRLYEIDADALLAVSYGNHDVAVCALMFDARALTLLGQTVSAMSALERGLALARSLGHPFTLALALVFAAAVHHLRRDPTAAQRYASEAAVLSRDHSFKLMLAWAASFEGWAKTALGQQAEGDRLLREATEAARATGSGQFRSHLLALLAESCLERHDAAAGLAVVADALDVVARTGERFHEADLHRLEGELRLLDGAPGAERAFTRAFDLARRQGTALFALRAANSLARLGGTPAAEILTIVEQASAGMTGDDTLRDLEEARHLLGRGADAT